MNGEPKEAKYKRSWTIVERLEIFTCKNCGGYFYMMEEQESPKFCTHCGVKFMGEILCLRTV